MRENHPDSLAARGVPQEFVKRATERSPRSTPPGTASSASAGCERCSIRDAPSPNQDDRPAGTPIDMLVLHYTGMRSGAEAIARLRDPAARVSSHYVVEEDGGVFRLVPEERRAWHAGVSHWRGARG